MKRYRIKPGQKVDLSDFDPSDVSEFKGGKKDAHDEQLNLTQQLITLQELLYAEHRHKVLIVLQAIDTGGKDGTISHVFDGVNPQGVRKEIPMSRFQRSGATSFSRPFASQRLLASWPGWRCWL